MSTQQSGFKLNIIMKYWSDSNKNSTSGNYFARLLFTFIPMLTSLLGNYRTTLKILMNTNTSQMY